MFKGLKQGRRRANLLMRSRVRISRLGVVEIDPQTLEARPSSREVLYEGVGKLQTYEAYEQNLTRAGASIVVTRLRCDIPVGVAQVKPGDLVEVLSNMDDPCLEGLQLRVAGVAPVKSIATAYRFFVDQVES